jgi:hypothetical protein
MQGWIKEDETMEKGRREEEERRMRGKIKEDERIEKGR